MSTKIRFSSGGPQALGLELATVAGPGNISGVEKRCWVRQGIERAESSLFDAEG